MRVNGFEIKPGAYLRGAYLQGANLRDVNLRDANLVGANLHGANLVDADLHGANLVGANLRGADLRGTNLTYTSLPQFQIPQHGTLTVWKATRGGLAKLLIPARAKRTASLVGRKCRSEYAKVLRVDGGNGESIHYGGFFYRVGEVIYPDSYNPDIRTECTNGIHFFLTREEAEEY